MSVVLLLLVIGAVVAVITVHKGGTRVDTPGASGLGVRQLFQYTVLYGLLVVAAVGLSGLLGRLFENDLLVAGAEAALARDLAFTVVGGPLFVVVALWSRRLLHADADERRSFAWACYATAASLTSLLLAMTGMNEVLRGVVGLDDFSGPALAQTVVWATIWVVHFRVLLRTVPPARARVHHLLGSLVGLVVAATGLVQLLTGALRVLLGMDGGVAVLAGSGSPMLQGLVTIAVAAPVWIVYWVRTASTLERDPLWLAYALLAGVGGGLVTAIVSASTLLYSVLVWLVGKPGPVEAAEHFSGAPGAAATTAVGVLVWWYHQAVLGSAAPQGRSEVRRVYEYLMAGIGLLAAAGGLITVLAALVEAATGTTLVGNNAINTLLAAATLLAVGSPVWWLFWTKAQAAAHQAPVTELASPTRRAYLFVLLGVGGVAAVIALLVAVYLLFQDFVAGTVDEETLRSMRFPTGVLITTAAVAAYHWTVYRTDREHAPEPPRTRGPRYVLLVGPSDERVAREVARHTQGRVQSWTRTDDAPGWSVDEVMAALDGTAADEVVVLAGAEGLLVVPVHRG